MNILIVCLFLAAQLSCLFSKKEGDKRTPSERPNVTKESLQSNAERPLIGFVQRTDLAGECGCCFQSNAKDKKLKGPYIFLTRMDEDAWMNINGQDIMLKEIETTEPKTELRKGDRYRSTYKAGEITVQLDHLVTKSCDPDDEACEFTYMDVTITVVQGDQRQIVKARGGCGC